VTRAILFAGVGWLLAAAGLGAAGIMRSLPAFAAPVAVVGLTLAVLAAAWRSPALAAWLSQLDERWIMALHLTRFVGIYFLYLHARGQLPYAFAVPGGWGDITVASVAAILLAAGGPRTTVLRRACIAWNVFGLIDILFVVVTAARLVLADPASMSPLLRLPLSLLPTFLVPLLIASHVVLGIRLAHSARAR
jgi:hypothetical protein